MKQYQKNVQKFKRKQKQISIGIGHGNFKDFPYYTLTPEDFCYFDPPSWIMDASFGQKLLGDWTKYDDKEVWRICNLLNDKKVPFAYTSVLEYKDQRYDELWNWAQEKEYEVLPIPKKYSSYSNKKYYDPKEEKPLEVLITNF